VQAEPPGAGVAVVRVDVAPVFSEQPERGGRSESRRERFVDKAGGRAGAETEQDGKAEVPLVQADAEQVDARPEFVALNPEHAHGSCCRLSDRWR
jgi:hypothetical protein